MSEVRLPGFDPHDSDTVHDLSAGVTKVCIPGHPKMAFFLVDPKTIDADANSVNLKVVSYVSMEHLTKETQLMIRAELELVKST